MWVPNFLSDNSKILLIQKAERSRQVFQHSQGITTLIVIVPQNLSYSTEEL